MSAKLEEVKMAKPAQDTPKILGMPMLDGFSKFGQLMVCTAGIFVFFVLYGYTQEWIFKDEQFKKFGWYLTLLQFFLYGIFASFEQAIVKHLVGPPKRGDEETATMSTLDDEPRVPHRHIPYKIYALVALLTVGTIGCSNASLTYLNYPTQVIFKCCKLIPVMIGGIFIQGKKYGFLDFSAAFLMTIGLIFFTLADVSLSPSFDMRGVALISLALLADACIGNVQENAMKKLKASNAEIIFYSYLMGSAYLFLGLVLTNQFIEPMRFVMERPTLLVRIFVFAFSGYIGLQFVLALVRIFGAFIAVTVTTCRKALSIIVSFMFFTKPFTIQYVWSGMIVVFGIFLNVYSKNRSRNNERPLGFKEVINCIKWLLRLSSDGSIGKTTRVKYQEKRLENV